MTISLDAANALESAIDGKIRQAAAPRRRASGTVSRVDKDGTVYAVLDSGIETVVEGLTASVNPGDTVSVTVENGRAEVLGNYTDPSAGVKYVRAVEGIAQDAGETAHAAVDSAAAAQKTADEAQKVAEATNQHFFTDTNGAHITDVTQDAWAAAVADNFSDYDPDTKPYHNQLLNSLGILLRTALNNLVSITRSAIAFYDGTGNTASNIVARFGSAGAQIGLTDESHISLDYHSMQMVDKQGNTFLNISDLLDKDGYIHDQFTGDGYETRFMLSLIPDVSSSYVVKVNGVVTTDYTITGSIYVNFTTAPALGAVIDVAYNINMAILSYVYAKAFTFGTRKAAKTVAASSTTFGSNNEASAPFSFAIGKDNAARAWGAVAEGLYTEANGLYSHAMNEGTIAASANQTVMGMYNAVDTNGDYALIIGNGTADDARSNAFAVTWSGAADLSHTLATEKHTKAYTAAANSGSGAVDITITKSGYTPIGIVGVGSGSQSVSVVEFSLLNDTTARCYFRNVSGSAASPTCNVTVLYTAVV